MSDAVGGNVEQVRNENILKKSIRTRGLSGRTDEGGNVGKIKTQNV